MKHALSLIPLMLFAACAVRPGDQAADPSLSTVQQAAVWDGGTPPCPSDAGSCVPTSPAIDKAAACPENRYIVVSLPNQGCPITLDGVGGKWNGGPLFELPRPPGLDRFCAYDWAPYQGGQAGPDKGALTAVFGQNARMDPDCHTVAALGITAPIQAGWGMFHSEFHLQSGRLPGLPLDTARPPSPIRVAVVDSSPHGYSAGEPGIGRYHHGLVMGEIIRELGCPAGPSAPGSACVAQISNHLALDLLAPGVHDPLNGGIFGQQTLTARAVHGALKDWDLHNASATPETRQPRLVINLSVGWDGAYGGAYNVVTDLPAPVRAVHAAITHAVCRGAVVIASAGNDPGGPNPAPGPAFPAGWEMKPAPTASQCAEMEGPAYSSGGEFPIFPSSPPASVYQPLVFAAGGVRGDDQSIAIARTGGRPRLAAPAAHALAKVTRPDGSVGPTDMYTGTSVAAAVASGVAATVWGYRPHLSGAEIMDLVRVGSVPLDVPADFCLGGFPCPWASGDARRTIRRVSVCGAVQTACGSGTVDRCPGTAFGCTTRGPYTGHVPRLTPAQQASIDGTFPPTTWDPTGGGAASYWTLAPGVGVCGHSDFANIDPAFPNVTCPFRQYYSAPLRPWTGPQPAANPCPACDVWLASAPAGDDTYDATLTLGIDPAYTSAAGAPLDEATVLVNGLHEIKLDGVGLIYAGQHKVIALPFETAWGPITKATLNFRSQRGGATVSTSSELIIHPAAP